MNLRFNTIIYDNTSQNQHAPRLCLGACGRNIEAIMEQNIPIIVIFSFIHTNEQRRTKNEIRQDTYDLR
nr:MAG TPA: hypothetical protein [Caudoviricetes sp.]